MFARTLPYLGAALCLTFCFSCSGKKAALVDAKPGLHYFSAQHIKIRRPEGPGADPKAEPGAPGRFATPRPDSNLDCKAPVSLFENLKLDEIEGCVSASKGRLVFQLVRAPMPYLELKPDPENTPECAKKFLSQIPVPREIIVQSNEEGEPYCYSSRLKIEEDEWLGARLPFHKQTLSVQLPQAVNDGELSYLLLSWALSVYWKDQKIEAVRMPRAICKSCFGEKGLLKSSDPEPLWWPSKPASPAASGDTSEAGR